MCSNSELDPCGEDMIPLSFHTVKPDGQAQIVPNQSVKASYATGHSTQYINYHCKKNLFYCCYLCLLNSALSFLHKAIDLNSNLSSFHFQPKDTDTHAYAHSWPSNDGDRNQHNNQLLGPFLL